MAREQRESSQQQEQVGQGDRFMLHVLNKTTDSIAKLKSSERELICGYGCKPRRGDWKRVMMEECNSKKGQSEHDKIDGNSKDENGFDNGRLKYERLYVRWAMNGSITDCHLHPPDKQRVDWKERSEIHDTIRAGDRGWRAVLRRAIDLGRRPQRCIRSQRPTASSI